MVIAPPSEVLVSEAHPAVYGKGIYPVFADLVAKYGIETVVDPFAGKGGIFNLRRYHPYLVIKGIEIEPRWANCHWETEVGDALNLPIKWTGCFDACFSSPTFGNRMADNFIDHQPQKKYKRNTYRHCLGDELQPNNSGKMHFGCDYAVFHQLAIMEARRVLKKGGIIAWEAKDFYETFWRKKVRVTRRVRVSLWFYHSFLNAGFTYLDSIKVYSRGNQQGANRKRVPYSKVLVFQKNS